MTRAEALSQGTQHLTAAGVETPGLDARKLLLEIEEIDAGRLIADPDTQMIHAASYKAAIDRRTAHEPVSKILGYKDFWTHRFYVTPDVLDPRPDTETLIEEVLHQTPKASQIRILDLGTGSGCILLTLLSELQFATGIGVDRSDAALAVANRNCAALKLSARADFVQSDWFEALDETFNLVVCNPPYISIAESETLSPDVSRWDPELALFAGMDGLQAYRKIADGLATVLKPNGTAFFEIGIGQADPVTALFENAGFRRIASRRDLGGHERCIGFAAQDS